MQGGEERDRWQIEGPKTSEDEDEETASSINEGGVEGGNLNRSEPLQAFAINWFERTQMFAFCLRLMLTSPLVLHPLAEPDHNRLGELLPDSSGSL